MIRRILRIAGITLTSIADPIFYECIEEDMYFKDWLGDAIIKDQPYSIGSSFLK